MSRPRIIALYLPQYHPFPENDEWWGKGFTEWTNVSRAKPLFRGHYQPHLPGDLGYYDLRLPIVREQQAELAKEAGIEGFCYWHYWFGNGKQLMEGIIDEVISTGKPDYPFCLGWANHSWYAKNWNSNDTSGSDRLLIEQTFPGDDDVRKHYEYALKAFKDPRYIKEGNKPFFMIYMADKIPSNFISLWNKWAIEDGFDGIYFVGNINVDDSPVDYISKGFSAVIKNRCWTAVNKKNKVEKKGLLTTLKLKWLYHFTSKPFNAIDYSEASRYFVTNEEKDEYIIPSLIPNFDHSPRSGIYGLIFTNSTPNKFYQLCKRVFEIVNVKQNKFVILRSWNEWGEGNYMEPEMRFGKGYIESLRKSLDELNQN